MTTESPTEQPSTETPDKTRAIEETLLRLDYIYQNACLIIEDGAENDFGRVELAAQHIKDMSAMATLRLKIALKKSGTLPPDEFERWHATMG